MDKVISEFRLVETEDGFRIEVKGDKEAMHKILRAAGHFRRHHHGRRGRRHGGFPFPPSGFCWGWDAGGWWEEEEEPEEEPGDEPTSTTL